MGYRERHSCFTRRRCAGSGRVNHEPERILDITAWWAGRADTEWSLSKSSCLQLPEGEINGKVYREGTELEVTKEEKHLGMSLRAEGLGTDVSEKKDEKHGERGEIVNDEGVVVGSTTAEPERSGFGAVVRAK